MSVTKKLKDELSCVVFGPGYEAPSAQVNVDEAVEPVLPSNAWGWVPRGEREKNVVGPRRLVRR